LPEKPQFDKHRHSPAQIAAVEAEIDSIVILDEYLAMAARDAV